MKLFDGLETLSEPLSDTTVAIGTFDGIHVGHQAIIRAAAQDAFANSRRSLVFTFDRHPAELLAPDRAPDHITTPAQRNRYVAELGIDGLVVAKFDRQLADLSPDAFLDRVLRTALGAKKIVVGDNFAFGRNRAGDAAFLEASQQKYGYSLIALEPVQIDGSPASSTRVRELLRAGSIAEAERVLGHAFRLAGTVIEGRKLGRQLGYPTANLLPQWKQVVPKDGIYAVQVSLGGGREVGGACSIGERPTVEGAGRSIETYLFDFNEDLYGHALEIRFAARLRDEERFDSLGALKAQIEADVRLAREVLARDSRRLQPECF